MSVFSPSYIRYIFKPASCCLTETTYVCNLQGFFELWRFVTCLDELSLTAMLTRSVKLCETGGLSEIAQAYLKSRDGNYVKKMSKRIQL